MRHTRESYQQGSLTTEPRKSGPDVWVFRWREQATDGSTVRRKEVVGSVKDFPNRPSAQKACMGLMLAANTASTTKHIPSLSEIADHYRKEELTLEKGKRQRTIEVYEHQLKDFILPEWGSKKVSELNPIPIEKWLAKMACSDGSRAKTRGVFSTLVKHGMRHGWASSNPIALVRQSAAVSREYETIDVTELQAILDELVNPFHCLVVVAFSTGLRRGELFGLRWEDVDFGQAKIRIKRSLVDQVEGVPKTLASRKPVPLAPDLAKALLAWREQSEYAAEKDWVFASPHALGSLPYWPDAVLKRQIRPAAYRAGVTKQIGWHCFRRSNATTYVDQGENVKTVQVLQRHATVETTLGIYAKAVETTQMNAQQRLTSLFSTVPRPRGVLMDLCGPTLTA